MIVQSSLGLKQYVQQENIEGTCLDGEWILLNPDRYMVTKLNGIGGLCWSMLRKPQTVGSLTRSVMRECTLDDSQAKAVEADIEAFLVELKQCDLIKDVR